MAPVGLHVPSAHRRFRGPTLLLQALRLYSLAILVPRPSKSRSFHLIVAANAHNGAARRTRRYSDLRHNSFQAPGPHRVRECIPTPGKLQNPRPDLPTGPENRKPPASATRAYRPRGGTAAFFRDRATQIRRIKVGGTLVLCQPSIDRLRGCHWRLVRQCRTGCGRNVRRTGSWHHRTSSHWQSSACWRVLPEACSESEGALS